MKAKLLSLLGLAILLMSVVISASAQSSTPVREPFVTPTFSLINVREGDSTAFRRVATLTSSDSASIIGINARRTWYQVQLVNGTIGWVGSSVVRVTGSLQDVPVVASPAGDSGTVAPTTGAPYVTTSFNRVNVREGDSTAFARIASLNRGETANIIGINARRTWYQIQLANGVVGWVASNVVRVVGNVTNVPLVSSTSPAQTTGLSDLSASPPKLEPATPTCGVAFNVLVNINNGGPNRTNAPATIYIENILNGNTVTAFTTVLPEIDPGTNYVVGGAMTINTGDGQVHTIRVTIDPENRVNETNINNNSSSTTYTLLGPC